MRIKRHCNLMLLASVANQVSASLAPQHSYPHGNINASMISQITRIRGGEGEGSSTPPPETTYNQYAAQNQQQQMANPNFQQPPSTTTNDPMYEYRETVEDRIDAWRKQQLNMQQTQSAAEAASVVDDQGRFRLFTTVSRVSVSLFFFILMWRTVHHYELADATFSSSRKHTNTGLRASLLRIVIVTPLVVLFLGEMMGAILGVTGGGSNASHTTKKRLKGILNLHKGVELVMMFYNVVRLAIWPSQYVMREVYIGRTISNFFFLMQAQLYTKLSWDEITKSTMDGGYATESYYDDYTQDMANYYDDQSTSWTPPTSSTESGEYYRQGDAPSHYEQQPNYGENSSEWGNQQ